MKTGFSPGPLFTSKAHHNLRNRQEMLANVETTLTRCSCYSHRMRTLARHDDLAAIVQRLKSTSPDDRALWGLMNAGEMICHLRGAFRVAMGEIPATPIRLSIPPTVLKRLALRAPLRWSKNFETLPALKRGTANMQVGVFEIDREETLAELLRFCKPAQPRVEHAYFGPMSVADWMRWGYLHTDHHLRQFGR